MEHLIEKILTFIVAKGGFGVFLASVLEEIVVPIPSTIIQTGAGFLFLAGQSITPHTIFLLVTKVALPAALGATLGSLMIYGLVWWGGALFVQRFGVYFMLSSKKIEHAKEYVLSHKSLIWAFCLVRFIPVLPSVFIAAVAGIIRLPFRVYFLTTLIGMFVRGLYLGFAGWMSGKAFHTVSSNDSLVGMFFWFAIGVLTISVVTMALVFYVRKKKQDHTD